MSPNYDVVPAYRRGGVTCPLAHTHTPAPTGYVEWHQWAARMSRAREQVRCAGCGLYQIWIFRRTDV